MGTFIRKVYSEFFFKLPDICQQQQRLCSVVDISIKNNTMIQWIAFKMKRNLYVFIKKIIRKF